MYIMSWVGIATTIGLVIEVLILLRSLADSLDDVNFDHLPLRFHPSLLAALDDGVATESLSCLVDSYACDWWLMPMLILMPMPSINANAMMLMAASLMLTLFLNTNAIMLMASLLMP